MTTAARNGTEMEQGKNYRGAIYFKKWLAIAPFFLLGGEDVNVFFAISDEIGHTPLCYDGESISLTYVLFSCVQYSRPTRMNCCGIRYTV